MSSEKANRSQNIRPQRVASPPPPSRGSGTGLYGASMEPKDYENDLDETEYNHFSGAIIFIAMIVACAVMIWLSWIGVL